METSGIITIAISVVFGMLYIIGICFLFGKGGELIAGFHRNPKTKRAKKYHKIIMRYFGVWFLCLVVLLHVGIVCGIYGFLIPLIAAIVCELFLAVGGLVFFNTNKKMKRFMILGKDVFSEEEHSESGDSAE